MSKNNILSIINSCRNLVSKISEVSRKKEIKQIEKPFCKGRHLLIDARNVPDETLRNSKKVMKALCESIEIAGANILTTTRHDFGLNSPPGYAMVVALDESHCSIHTYADLGLMAIDFFTCSTTDPEIVFKNFIDRIDIGTDFSTQIVSRFTH